MEPLLIRVEVPWVVADLLVFWTVAWTFLVGTHETTVRVGTVMPRGSSLRHDWVYISIYEYAEGVEV